MRRMDRMDGILSVIRRDDVKSFYKEIMKKNQEIHFETILGYAVENKAHNIAHFLLKQGTSPHIEHGKDRPLISLATLMSDKKMVRLLLKYGANINQKAIFGMTPLHIAIGQQDSSMVKFLTNCGCQLNIKNDGGFTPLYQACNKESFKSVFELMRNGVDVHEEDIQRIRQLRYVSPADSSLFNLYREMPVSRLIFIQGRINEQICQLKELELPKYQNLVSRDRFHQELNAFQNALDVRFVHEKDLKCIVKRLNHILNHPVNDIPRDHSFQKILLNQHPSGKKTLPYIGTLPMQMILDNVNRAHEPAFKPRTLIEDKLEQIYRFICALKNKKEIPYDYEKGTHSQKHMIRTLKDKTNSL